MFWIENAIRQSCSTFKWPGAAQPIGCTSEGPLTTPYAGGKGRDCMPVCSSLATETWVSPCCTIPLPDALCPHIVPYAPSCTTCTSLLCSWPHSHVPDCRHPCCSGALDNGLSWHCWLYHSTSWGGDRKKQGWGRRGSLEPQVEQQLSESLGSYNFMLHRLHAAMCHQLDNPAIRLQILRPLLAQKGFKPASLIFQQSTLTIRPQARHCPIPHPFLLKLACCT